MKGTMTRVLPFQQHPTPKTPPAPEPPGGLRITVTVSRPDAEKK
jgi:hypothetical protein